MTHRATTSGERRARWTKRRVLEIRAEVKTELDQIEARSGRPQRLAACLRRVRELESDVSSFGVLRCYTYVCSALVHETRHGGLPASTVRRLVELAEDLLRLQGVEPFRSPLSFLYADVQNLAGQLARQQGDHWGAAWHTQLMLHHSGDAVAATPLSRLTVANRALRIGQASLAAEGFAAIGMESGATAEVRRAALLGRVKALRLAGSLEAARVAAAAAHAETAVLGDDGRLELAWEQACVEAQASGEIAGLLMLLRGRPRAEDLSYRLEAGLWVRAQGRALYPGIPANIATLKRRFVAASRPLRLLVRAADLVESLHDVAIPFYRRLRLVTELDELARRQVSVDKELLVWAAAARWLQLTSHPEMADAVAAPYHRWSLHLTTGARADVLGVLTGSAGGTTGDDR